MPSTPSRHPARRAAAAATVALAASWPGLTWAADWQLTLLSGLEEARAINNLGSVAGNTGAAAAVWSNGRTELLANAPGIRGNAYATAINDNGMVGGWGANPAPPTGFSSINQVWMGGSVTTYNPISFGASSFIESINNAGQTVGNTWFDLFDNTAVLYDSAGNASLLPGLTNPFKATAMDINQAGVAVGSSDDVTYRTAVRWQGGLAEPLLAPGWFNSGAAAINSAGQVVGGVSNASGTIRRGAVWDSGNFFTLDGLGGLPAEAMDVNDAGLVLGLSGDPVLLRGRITLWDVVAGTSTDLTQVLIDLNAAAGGIWDRWWAAGLNNAGQVAVTGWDDQTGTEQAFILGPASNGGGGGNQVPEPQSLLLAGLALTIAWRNSVKRSRRSSQTRAAVLALLGLSAHGLSLALPANEIITRYYSDETMKRKVGSATLRCSGKTTHTGHTTEFEMKVTGLHCGGGPKPKDPKVPCSFTTDPTCAKLPGSPD